MDEGCGSAKSAAKMPEVLPRVSILIPCHNGKDYVGRAIESCLVLDYPDVEIIVIDDGSADGSATLVERYEGVLCIRQANQGVSAARNNGIAAATGDFIVFLDHDDELTRDALRIGVALLQEKPEISFTFGLRQTVSADGHILSDQLKPDVREGMLTYAGAFHAGFPVPPSLALFRSEAVRQVGGFDTRMQIGEDYDFFLRVLRTAPAWRHNTIVTRYRRHGSNVSQQKATALKAVLTVLDAQANHVAGDPEMEAELRAGKREWERLFGGMIPGEIVRSVKAGEFRRAISAAQIFVRHAPGTVEGIVSRCAQR
jgi:glycosyltransferase involved in cell wall biosynthesis